MLLESLLSSSDDSVEESSSELNFDRGVLPVINFDGRVRLNRGMTTAPCLDVPSKGM